MYKLGWSLILETAASAFLALDRLEGGRGLIGHAGGGRGDRLSYGCCCYRWRRLAIRQPYRCVLELSVNVDAWNGS